MINIFFRPTFFIFKGSDRLCMVVKLSIQYCRHILKDSFETYKTILRRIFNEFECKVDFQNHLFGWIRFENSFFLILNNDDKKCKKNFFSKLISSLGTG